MSKRPFTWRLWASLRPPPCLCDPGASPASRAIRKDSVKGGLALMARSICAVSLVWLSVSVGSAAENLNPQPTPPNRLEETNSEPLLKAVLLLEEQLRSTQLAIEQSQKEAKEAAARNADMLSNGLQTIERALSVQEEAASTRSARELDALRGANRVTLLVAGAFAAMVLLAMLIITCFLWRMSKVWTGISAAFPMPRGLDRGSVAGGLSMGDQHGGAAGSSEESKLRLLGAMERLEKRIQELEQGSRPALAAQATSSSSGDNGNLSGSSTGNSTAENPGQTATNGPARISALLRQGQLKLKENDIDAALKCFDEVLSLAPTHSEALVKKGAALERLQKLNEAFECYDRAIAADSAMTVAYLHKGGLCNRLERFKEALECYEKALQTHDEGRG